MDFNAEKCVDIFIGMAAGIFLCLAGKLMLMKKRKKPTSVIKKALKLINAIVCMTGSTFGV